VFINKKEKSLVCRVPCSIPEKTHDCSHFERESKCVLTQHACGALWLIVTDSSPQIFKVALTYPTYIFILSTPSYIMNTNLSHYGIQETLVQ
jgi:hypothetical protein